MKLGEIINKLMPLLEDAGWAESLLEKDDNQFTRRAYIRNMFATIEGSIWILKQTILMAPVENGKTKRLDVAVYTLLSDITYDLKSNGAINKQIKYLKLPENIRFTFNVLGKYFGIEFDLGIETAVWHKFLQAQKIRNKITHPKTQEEFNVSDKDIAIVKEVFSWFNELIYKFTHTISSRAQLPIKLQQK